MLTNMRSVKNGVWLRRERARAMAGDTERRWLTKMVWAEMIMRNRSSLMRWREVTGSTKKGRLCNMC